MTIIDEYYADKARQKRIEELNAWMLFYMDCNNEKAAFNVKRQLELA